MGGGEWRIASGRRRRGQVLRSPCWTNGGGWSTSSSCEEDDGALEDRSRQLEAAVQRAVERVDQSAFYKALRRQLLGFQGGGGLKSRLSQLGCKSAAAAPTVELVVYGVGSIEDSEASRCQLALALLLRRDVETIAVARVYDPVLSAPEVRAIQRLGCLTIAAEEQARRQAAPTLFFMPHCGARLYDNVLEANWASLSSIAILGNSFYAYVQQCRGGRGATAPPLHLLDGARRAEEYVVRDMDFPATSAFNDMSWHFFP